MERIGGTGERCLGRVLGRSCGRVGTAHQRRRNVSIVRVEGVYEEVCSEATSTRASGPSQTWVTSSHSHETGRETSHARWPPLAAPYPYPTAQMSGWSSADRHWPVSNCSVACRILLISHKTTPPEGRMFRRFQQESEANVRPKRL